MDGGGGGGAPSQTTNTTTSIPEYARPYVEETLGKASALTKAPYQTYTGERSAQFSPLQKQGFDAVGGMQVAPQIGQASGLAGLAASTALGAGSTYQPYQPGGFTGNTAGAYMDPYMQNVVGIQQREAQRQAEIAATGRNAQAVGAGAYGGSRQAIMDAEAARNLAQQQGDIQARGSQAAYASGQQQFNTEQQLGEQAKQYRAGLGLQGLSTALSGANTLGTLGAAKTQQGLDIIGAQQAAGSMQQKQMQGILDTQYQDFLNQQNNPYKQLGYMSDLLRGTAGMTQQSNQVYNAPPSGASQLAALGTAAYGLSKNYQGGAIKKPTPKPYTTAPGKKKAKAAGLAELALTKMS